MWPKKKKDQPDESRKSTPQKIEELKGRVDAAIAEALRDAKEVQKNGRAEIDKMNALKNPPTGKKE